MKKFLNPSKIHPPFANYSHGVVVAPGHTLLFCSGQLGIDKHGDIPMETEDQAKLCFEAIAAILRDADMSMRDVVRLNAYVTSREHLGPYMKVRDLYIKSPPPASTLVVVSGFARPEFNVEVEAVAARKID